MAIGNVLIVSRRRGEKEKPAWGAFSAATENENASAI